MIEELKKIEWQIDIARELHEKHNIKIVFREECLYRTNMPYKLNYTKHYNCECDPKPLQIISIKRDCATNEIKSVLFSENIERDCFRTVTKYHRKNGNKRIYIHYKKPLEFQYTRCHCRECNPKQRLIIHNGRCLKRWI